METFTGAVFIAILIVIVYVFLPFLFRYSKAFQRQLVFLPYNILADGIEWRLVNYERPDLFGLRGASNLYVNTETDVRVGVWHILPESLVGLSCPDVEINSLASGHPIVLYLHGNSGTRATRHRMEMYKLLQSLDYHIVTLDYRGFAESSPVSMSEDGAVTDATSVWNYIRKYSTGNSSLIIWGHSLGTAVAIKMVAQLSTNNQQRPDRLVLESPFNNISAVFRTHPLTRMYRVLSFADRFFTERLQQNNLAFDSELYIGQVDCPTLMLHAQDDPIVSIDLCRQLYKTGLNHRPDNWPPLKLIEFNRDFGCRHEYICRVPHLPSIIQEFVVSGTKQQKMDHLQPTIF